MPQRPTDRVEQRQRHLVLGHLPPYLLDGSFSLDVRHKGQINEVEIHHADLRAGYSHTDWSPEFSATLIESMRSRAWPSPFRVMARVDLRSRQQSLSQAHS